MGECLHGLHHGITQVGGIWIHYGRGGPVLSLSMASLLQPQGIAQPSKRQQGYSQPMCEVLGVPCSIVSDRDPR